MDVAPGLQFTTLLWGLHAKPRCLRTGDPTRELRTGERTHLLQGGPQLHVVALESAPVNLQLSHCFLEVLQPSSPQLLLFHSETRLSLCS